MATVPLLLHDSTRRPHIHLDTCNCAERLLEASPILEAIRLLPTADLLRQPAPVE